MASNNNGFADALEQINTLMKVDQKVSMVALEEAADYFAKKLLPRIPKSNRNKEHLVDNLKVVVKKDMVQVIFEDSGGWYWHLVEHGHKKANGRGKVRGAHFVKNTMNAEENKIAEIMTEKVIEKMKG